MQGGIIIIFVRIWLLYMYCLPLPDK